MYNNDNNKSNRVVFLTGTRADYGKMKSLIRSVRDNTNYEPYIFATGMHMLSKYGSTYKEIVKDGFDNIYTYINQGSVNDMSITLSNTITGFTNYVAEVKPIAIVVHGDRLEALAGAIVGAFNNIRVLHIEGGEVSGTIDESIRHAITKFSHIHFVSNEAAKLRIIQLGEPADNIYVFGSPDIDIMHSKSLPSLEKVKKHYNFNYDSYNIFMYHPVTTELDYLKDNIHQVVKGLIMTEDKYVVIYPNNDSGTDTIIDELKILKDNPNFKIYPSMRFESFLSLLKNSKCIMGNSSSGIREACIYGVPAIDIGNRQLGRYDIKDFPHIIHASEDANDILRAYKEIQSLNPPKQSFFGAGNSAEIFVKTLNDGEIFNVSLQKKFVDIR